MTIVSLLQGGSFNVPAGSLSFSVTIYSICAFLCVMLLLVRRYLPFFGKGELGGPSTPKYATGAFLISLWFIYVLLSSLVVYEYIPSF